MDKNIINDSSVTDYLNKLGLSRDQARVYLTLVNQGVLTKLELSRKSKIKRTNVYRLVDSMKSLGVIEEIVDEHRRLVQAVPPNRLERLLKEKQDQVAEITNQFPDVQKYLQQQVQSRQPETRVLFYKDQEGIRQMAWNALRAKGELVGYTYRVWESAIGEKYARKWYQEAIEKGFRMREIYSDDYLKSIQKNKTVYDELTVLEQSAISSSRYIPSKTLDIKHQMDIYNDVVAIYNWHEGEVFGVEIYNSKVAKLQKQIFEVLWKLGKIIK